MPEDYFHTLLSAKVDAGEASQEYWWDESRIPLASIDKRVTELLDLTGKRAVITGGAGINLGQACVNRLAGLGADVAVVDLSPEVAASSGHQRHAAPPDATQIAKAAAEKWGAKVVPIHGDVTDWDGVNRAMAEAADQLGGIDILVNNAADTAVGDFAGFTREDIDRTAKGTLLGPIYCSRVALDYMLPQGDGRIINIGSEAGMSAMPLLTLYGTMKGGLATFTRFLGKEVARHGVRVLGVNAGSMWGPGRPLTDDVPQTLYPRARTGIQRYELPEEVANMVAFLASDASSAMAGVMIDMGGGMSV
ncbi:SDR family NAD(P)-dependent oxidoreductase [Amycolatopsis sp. GM8]|uniref:SDR family NAD(P)-dependent oxidoreductase n=1 Tax=Amycolatopsis sp. GM8 TaxID=2896530 RepID=UPI001F271516|nr:SDR family oxidoreductase [Amycolatopsis sp. GM8]